MLTKGKKVIMKYDFTSILDRNGKDAIAVEHSDSGRTGEGRL